MTTLQNRSVKGSRLPGESAAETALILAVISSGSRHQKGPFELNEQQAELKKNGAIIELTPKRASADDLLLAAPEPHHQ